MIFYRFIVALSENEIEQSENVSNRETCLQLFSPVRSFWTNKGKRESNKTSTFLAKTQNPSETGSVCRHNLNLMMEKIIEFISHRQSRNKR